MHKQFIEWSIRLCHNYESSWALARITWRTYTHII